MKIFANHHKESILNILLNAEKIDEISKLHLIELDLVNIFGGGFVFINRTIRTSYSGDYNFSDVFYVKNKNNLVEKYKQNKLVNIDPIFRNTQNSIKPIITNLDLCGSNTNSNTINFINIFRDASINNVITYHYKQTNRIGTYFVSELTDKGFEENYYCRVASIITPHISLALHRIYTNIRKTRIKPLTKKEIQVLELLASGKSIIEIGEMIYLSERTIRFHINNIIHKLEVKNKLQAVTLASSLDLF